MAIFHLSASAGSRGKGAGASSKEDYLKREGKYRNGEGSKGIDELAYTESGNMPTWAETSKAYWNAADEHERENGCLYRQIEAALPRELDEGRQIELVREFTRKICQDDTPYTVAVHRGLENENPHMHLMFSERALDGIERTKETWFRRANTKEPEKGGAKKKRGYDREWVQNVRVTWEEITNQALERAGVEARIDHRTNEAQGIDRVPRYLPLEDYRLADKGILTNRAKAMLASIDEENALRAESKALTVEAAKIEKQLGQIQEIERGGRGGYGRG